MGYAVCLTRSADVTAVYSPGVLVSSRWDSDLFGPPDDEVIVPEVITGDMVAGEDDDDIPPVVHTPTESVWDGGEQPPALVLRELEDGSVAMLVYTSPEAMAAGCGGGQPYLSVRSEGLAEFRYWLGIDQMLWDAVLAPELRQYASSEPDAEGDAGAR